MDDMLMYNDLIECLHWNALSMATENYELTHKTTPTWFTW